MNGETLKYAREALADLQKALAPCEPLGTPTNDLRTFDDLRRDYQTRRPDHHWFDRDAMRFFGTRAEGVCVRLPEQGVTLFMTSETPPNESRRYSIRAYRWADADIETLGPFAQHTAARARTAFEYVADHAGA
jgi:hypothetical protein